MERSGVAGAGGRLAEGAERVLLGVVRVVTTVAAASVAGEIAGPAATAAAASVVISATAAGAVGVADGADAVIAAAATRVTVIAAAAAGVAVIAGVAEGIDLVGRVYAVYEAVCEGDGVVALAAAAVRRGGEEIIDCICKTIHEATAGIVALAVARIAGIAHIDLRMSSAHADIPFYAPAPKGVPLPHFGD